jgi:hypothetical protein
MLTFTEPPVTVLEVTGARGAGDHAVDELMLPTVVLSVRGIEFVPFAPTVVLAAPLAVRVLVAIVQALGQPVGSAPYI